MILKSEEGLLGGIYELQVSELTVEINYYFSREPEKKLVCFYKQYPRQCDVDNKVKAFKNKYLNYEYSNNSPA